MPDVRLLILARYPEPGKANTRLCPPLTPEDAAIVHRSCLRLACERAFRVWNVRPTLMITPDDSEEAFREIVGPYIPIKPQGDGDLGDRLARAVDVAFEEGQDTLLIIGTDSPTMPAARFDDACAALANHDAVIGPCDDGGFYLLGLKKTHSNLFRKVDWGTSRTCKQWVKQATACGLKLTEIEPWYDIDRADDLTRAMEDIRSAGPGDDYELLTVLESVTQRTAKRRTTAKR